MGNPLYPYSRAQVKNALDPERPQTANSLVGQDYNFPHLDIIGERSVEQPLRFLRIPYQDHHMLS